MKFRLGLVVFLASFFAASTSSAIVEARLTYGLLASSPSFEDLRTSTTAVPSAVANAGLGVDALVFVPLTGLGFGVRYENLGFKAGGNGLEYDSKTTRTAAMATYRFINTLLHLGTTFTYGLSHSGSIEVTDGANRLKWEPGSTSSYSLGLDVGVGLAGFVLGGEAGYQSMKWTGMKDGSGTSGSTPDTDMSGTYFKAYFGIGF